MLIIKIMNGLILLSICGLLLIGCNNQVIVLKNSTEHEILITLNGTNIEEKVVSRGGVLKFTPDIFSPRLIYRLTIHSEDKDVCVLLNPLSSTDNNIFEVLTNNGDISVIYMKMIMESCAVNRVVE